MKRRRVIVGGTVAGAIVGLATAASKAWTAASKELWRLDDELGEDEDIPPGERPFLSKLTSRDGSTERSDPA